MDLPPCGLYRTTDRTPHAVIVPWQGVFGMVTEHGQGLLWTADVPFEILDQMLQISTDDGAGKDDQPVAPPAPAMHLRPEGDGESKAGVWVL